MANNLYVGPPVSSQFPPMGQYNIYKKLDSIRDDPIAIAQTMKELQGNINRNCNPIYEAIMMYNFIVLDILLKNDVNFDSKLCLGGREHRPVIFAALEGNVQAVEILIKHGACVKCKDRNGLTLRDYVNDWVGEDKKRILWLLNEYG